LNAYSYRTKLIKQKLIQNMGVHMAGSMPSGSPAKSSGDQQKTQTFAFIVMTCLFFFWGFITVLNDLLIPYFKRSFDLTYFQSMLVQSAFFGAYLVISPFAGLIIDKFGYKKGIILGLLVAAVGCFLFYPSADLNIYLFFLLSLFVLASGITILQVAANPYVAALGPDKTAESRLNLAQAANSFGTFLGPKVSSVFILGAAATATASAVKGPYVALGTMLVAIAIIFSFIDLPRITSVGETSEKETESIWGRRPLVLGALAIFLYVGAEVAIGSILVDYFLEVSSAELSFVKAGEMVAYYWGAAMVGRLIGALAMRYIAPTKYLAVNALIAILMIIISVNTTGLFSMWSILAVGLFNSIMFPTIFTLAVKGLGSLTSKGSGLVCQGIVGGAIIPPIMGFMADHFSLTFSFIVPILCYIYICWYALRGADQS
jgi:FHS family L-fucose permease-like MFS transporter